MKQLGVDHLVSVSTAGSMKEELRPGDLVVPDQFIDHTYKRPATFFGDGIVAHVSLADPVCAALARELVRGGRRRRHDGASRRRVSLHRGAAVFHSRRIESLPALGRRRDQHDGDAGGAARARGRDVLRGAGAGDRLRLLARERRGGRYRRNSARDAAQRRACAERRGDPGAADRHAHAQLRVPAARSTMRSSPTAR